jgi:hypothetical protein
VKSLVEWLEAIGLGKYAETFANENITFDILQDLTDEYLRELGFSLGDRVRYLKAIKSHDEIQAAGDSQNPLSIPSDRSPDDDRIYPQSNGTDHKKLSDSSIAENFKPDNDYSNISSDTRTTGDWSEEDFSVSPPRLHKDIDPWAENVHDTDGQPQDDGHDRTYLSTGEIISTILETPFENADHNLSDSSEDEWEDLEDLEDASISEELRPGQTLASDQVSIKPLSALELEEATAGGDWWVEDEYILEPSDEIEGDETWEETALASFDFPFNIPDFDGQAFQSPWDVKDANFDQLLFRAQERAAAVVSLLDWNFVSERENALIYLTDFFQHLKHPATFRAIRFLAENGLTLSELVEMSELRRVWSGNPKWWQIRYHGKLALSNNGRRGLTWKLAHFIIKSRPDYPTEQMIDDDWYDEWINLSYGDIGYFRFSEFIALKVNSHQAETLYLGLSIITEWNENDGIAHRHGWYRNPENCDE